MACFLTVKGAIVFVLMLLVSLWFARQLKLKRPSLPGWGALCLACVILFEPAMLAYAVWCIHEQAAENGALMIYAYTFLKAAAFVYLLFILPSVYFAWQFFRCPNPLTMKALRFGYLLPIAFAAVTFLEAPKMIWGERASMITETSVSVVIAAAVLNLVLLALTFLRPRKTK